MRADCTCRDFQPTEPCNTRLEAYELRDGHFRLTVLNCDLHTPSVILDARAALALAYEILLAHAKEHTDA